MRLPFQQTLTPTMASAEARRISSSARAGGDICQNVEA